MFKCEVCKRPLEDLKAGDSIWIYRKAVHCVPCYAKAKGESQEDQIQNVVKNCTAVTISVTTSGYNYGPEATLVLKEEFDLIG